VTETAPRPAITLRPYQAEAVASVMAEFKRVKSTIMVLPTGGGKTATAGELIRRGYNAGRSILWLAHRQELIEQAAEAVARASGCTVEVEMAERSDASGAGSLFERAPGQGRVVVASVMSLVRRLHRFPVDAFDLVITDECFPAGTLIDGVPIETLRVGDEAACFDHERMQVARRNITHLFRSTPSALIMVKTTDGESIVCTPGHPFYVPGRGYVPALQLRQRELLLRNGADLQALRSGVQLEVQAGSVLAGVQGRARPGAQEDRLHRVPRLRFRGGRSSRWRRRASSPANGVRRPGLLFDRLQAGGSATVERGGHGSNEPGVRLGAHDREQPHGEARNPSQDVRDAAAHRPRTEDTGRQRARTNGARNAPLDASRLANKRGSSDGYAEGERVPDLLQDRRGESGAEDRRRGGRLQPLVARTQGSGREEDGVSRVTRVASVEVLEPGSDGRFGGLCPDGHVYNIEVEEHHNYFANGILVHNCHRGLAASYVKVYDHFSTAKRLGLTATPERGDKKSLITSVDPETGELKPSVFETVSFDYSLFDAIHDGWLVPIRRAVVSMKIDLSGVHTRAGDFAADELSAVMSGIDALREASVAIVLRLEGRQALVFCVDVAHVLLQAESLREVMRDKGIVGRVAAVHGETPKGIREEIFAAYRRGEVKVLLNCEIATEGTDLPTCSLVAMLRPTKSRVLFSQQRGRGLRALPGVVDGPATAEARRAAIAASAKPDVLVLDLAGNFGRHVDDVVDALDGLLSDDDPDAAEVRRILARGDTDDLMKAIELARRARFGRERLRLAKDGDIFALFGILRETDRWGRPMTDKQRAALLRVLADPKKPTGYMLDGIDLRGANQAITEIKRRETARLCTYKQARALARWNVPLEVVEVFTFKAATQALSTLAANGWKPGDGSWWRDAASRDSVPKSDGMRRAAAR
jgi:superfamily II DNA or RNA helicase